MTALAPTLQAFFTERLIRQRHASGHTIAAYRDTLRLLLIFASTQTAKKVCRLDIADLNAPLVAGFLDHLERQRGNSVRTRNARLAAIHSLFAYAALRHPEHAHDIGRVLPSPPNAPAPTSCPTSPKPKWTRSSARSTPPPGTDAATRPCSGWPPRPGCASPN